MKRIYIICAILFVSTFNISCDLDEIENPNAPTVGSFAEGATRGDLLVLVTGLEAVMRNDLEFHYDTVGILGRDYYDLTGIDPRLTGELLKGPLDNNGFLTTRSYAAWYKIVKSANILIEAVENSAAGYGDQEKNGYYGFANTLKAYALLMVANRQYSNGIRLDVADADNLGPTVGYNEALSGVMSLLDAGQSQLSSAGSGFDFTLSDGFEGFNSPSTFSQFNRALAARTALYQGNMSQVLSNLSSSFMDMGGDLWNGVANVFGGTGNDILNDQFHVLSGSGTADAFMAHPSWIADAEAGDMRVANKSQLFEPGTRSFDGLTADYQIALYKTNTDPVYMIRNEELILMYAEANIGTDNTEAVNAINVIRNAAGLANYSGATDDTSLLDEVLHQRRYSLFVEGHRWIDLRRMGKLNPTYIPLDRSGDNVIDAFPTPFTEGL